MFEDMSQLTVRQQLTISVQSKIILGDARYLDSPYVQALSAGLHIPVRDNVAFAKVSLN